MNDGAVPAALAGHPALVGGARRGLGFALAGLLVCVVAAGSAAWTLWRDGAEADAAGRIVTAVLAATIAAFGVIDAWIFGSFRRRWAGSDFPAWHPNPRMSCDSAERRSFLVLASAAWDMILRLALFSAWGVFSTASYLSSSPRHGGVSAVSIASALATGVVVFAIRRDMGHADVRVVFVRSELRTGTDVEILVHVATTRTELPPEAFVFALRCIRGLPPKFGVLPRTEPVAQLEPVRRKFTSTGRYTLDWRLTFAPPAELPGADLLAWPPIYWELTVEAIGSRSAYRDRFLVPMQGAMRTPVTP